MEMSKIELPKAGYKFRIMAAERGVSGKGNPKADVDVEIYDHPNIIVKNDEGFDEEVTPNNLQVRHWLTFTEKALGPLNTFLKSVGAPPCSKDELATYNVKQLEGLVGAGIFQGKRKVNVGADGQPIINLNTNQPMTMVENRLIEVMPR